MAVREWKKKQVEELENLIEKYPVVATVNIEGLPAKQFQQIRDKLRGKAKIKVAKKTLMEKALEDEQMEELEKYMEGSVALIMTDINPFKLQTILKNSRAKTKAKPGQIAPKDIIAKEGDTGMSPGPVLGTLKSVGVQAMISEGSIKIRKDSVIAEEGDEITSTEAQVMSQLDIEPMEVGMNLEAAYEGDQAIPGDVLDIDTEKFAQDLSTASQAAANISVNANYFTEQSTPMILGKAHGNAFNLAIETVHHSSRTAKTLLQKAFSHAKTISQMEEN